MSGPTGTTQLLLAIGIPLMNDNLFGLAAADLNGDGLVDLLVARSKQFEASTGALRNTVLWGRAR